MISLHNVSSAGEALHYFSQDNYYTEHQGLDGWRQLPLAGGQDS